VGNIPYVDENAPQGSKQDANKAMKESSFISKVTATKEETNLKQIKSTENIIQKQLIEKSKPASPKTPEPGPVEGQGHGDGQEGDDDYVDGQAVTPGGVDPKLQLLDSQLRNILKPESQASSVSDVKKVKDGERDGEELPRSHMSPSPLKSPHTNESTKRQLPKIPVGAVPYRKLSHESGLMEKSTITEKKNGMEKEAKIIDTGAKCPLYSDVVRNDNAYSPGREEVLIVEINDDRHVARMVGSSEGRLTDGESRGEDRGETSQQGQGIFFGGIEERSFTNQNEDAPTNMYLDDHATRAAPYTLASQFQVSMASSEEDTDDEHSTKFDSMAKPPLGLGQSPFSERRRGSHILKHIQDASEKLNEKLSAREFGKRRELSMEFHRESDSMREFADESFSHVLSEHRPIKSILEEIPKPKFSTRSPSSPAKLSCLPKPSSPLKPRQQLFVNNIPMPHPLLDPDPLIVNGIDHDLAQPLYKGESDEHVDLAGDVVFHVPGPVKSIPSVSAAREDEASDGSDTEPQPHHRLKQDIVHKKLMALKLEERGIADGESPRPFVGEEQLRETPSQSMEQDNSNLASAVSSSSRPAPTKAGPMISLPFFNSVDADQLAANMNKIPVENSIDVYRTNHTMNGQDQSTPVEEGFYLHKENSPDWKHELPLNGQLNSCDHRVVDTQKPIGKPAMPSSSNTSKDNNKSMSHTNHAGARPKTLDLENSYDSSSRSTSESSAPHRRSNRIRDSRQEQDSHGLLSTSQVEDYSLVRASIDVLMHEEHLSKTDDRGRCKPPRPPRGSRPVMVASTAR
jgi:hypothetical protein